MSDDERYLTQAEAGAHAAGYAAGERKGAARAFEQCRRLAEEAAAEAPNGWMREALERFAASLPTTASRPTTAGELLANYRPAPPSVVSALRAAVEAFPCPDEPQDEGGE